MLIDSGAGPSVIDLGTIRSLGLESKIQKRPTRIYGVGKEPIHVVGNISLTVDLGDDQRISHPFGVLQETSTIRILGRDFLSKFGPPNSTGMHDESDLGAYGKLVRLYSKVETYLDGLTLLA